MFSPYRYRADIQTTSATTINFAATTRLASDPIRLWAVSGRLAAITSLPTDLTISGVAGTRYVYASLAAPSGSAYSTASGDILHRILGNLGWNRADFYNGFRAFHPGDGTVVDSARNSVVTLVETASSTPPDTHHVPLGQFECANGVISSLTSFQNQVEITISSFTHGQCQLVLSGGNLVLMPYNGSGLFIGSATRNLPAAGVSIAPTGLTPGTFYPIFASWTGSAITLSAEVATTAVDTSTGVTTKAGDSLKTYVGYGYIDTGPVWSPVVQVRSHFNDPNPTVLMSQVADPILTVSATNVETAVWNTKKLRNNLLANGAVRMTVQGDSLCSGSALGFKLRLKYGSTTVAAPDIFAGLQNATRFGWVAEFLLRSRGATNKQIANGYLRVNAAADISGGDGGSGGGNTAFSSHSGVAEDSTQDLALDLTVQNETNSSNISTRVYSVLVEHLKA